MKLEYQYDEKGSFVMKCFLVALTLTVVLGFLTMIISGGCEWSVGLLFIFIYGVLSIYCICNLGPSIKLKEAGRKLEAEIVKVKREYSVIGRGTNRYENIIEVSYENKVKKIRCIKYNKAFYILSLLLKECESVPIEIYVKKNKVYADLDSVDLTKIKGYDEMEKIAEKEWKRKRWGDL